MSRYRSKYIICLIIIIVFGTFISACGRTESNHGEEKDAITESDTATEEKLFKSDQIIEAIHADNIQEAVLLCNDLYHDSDLDAEVSDAFQEYISDTALSFYSEEIEYEQANNILKEIQNIRNPDIKNLAADCQKEISTEYNGNNLLVEAEGYYEKGDLLSTMKTLSEIQETYSQYDYAEELYNTCKQEILEKTEDIGSDEEYEDTQKYLETVLETIEDEDIRAARDRLADGFVAFTKVSGVIENAEGLYEKGQYGESFASLEEGINTYSDDQRLQDYLDVYREVYITKVTQEVGILCKEKEYKEAKTTISDAINEYDCDEFQNLLNSVNEQSKLTNRLRKNAIGIMELVDQGCKSEKEKVENDGVVSYVIVSGEKLLLGDYSEEEITVLSFSGDIIASFANLDMLFDIRDLIYDVTHWGEQEFFVIYLATDVVALLPMVGCVKHLMVADTVAAGIQNVPELIKKLKKASNVADTVADTVKDTGKLSEAAEKAKQIIKKAENASNHAIDKAGHFTFVNTINSKYVNGVHPKTNVPFVRKRIKYQNGNVDDRIAGVFPVFDSAVDVQLPKNLWKESFDKQKSYLLKELQKMVDSGDMKKLGKLTKEEIEDIKNGVLPAGYVWHHNEEEGLMQLVDETLHDQTAHSGGMSLWGKGHE